MVLSDMETIPETGAVFTIGRSRFADNVASHFFIRKDPVVSITCGDEHSAVICQSGRLFVFGSNDWGQLGLGHKNHVGKPSCVKSMKPEKVTHVACGRAHTLISTGARKIFACGSDQEGQLGRGSSAVGDSVTTPVLVHDSGPAGPEILQLAAGSHHSLALTSDGGVLAWGSNLEGQLGVPGVSGLMNKPTKVHIPEAIKEIDTGYYHSVFLAESGNVRVCGESESGKLGIDINFSTQVAPKEMHLPTPAVHVACGGHHTLILTDNGNLYCAGSNASGQLGMGRDVIEISTPRLLPRQALENEAIARIACGESHTAVLTDSGKLFTCGDGRHGKLGLEENENNVHALTFAPKYHQLFVSNVSCGGCHTILVARRRETSRPQETESTQMDQLQKRTASLPPLKLVPLGGRLQNENQDEKFEEKSDQEATMKSIEEEESSKTEADSTNGIEECRKPESTLQDSPMKKVSPRNERKANNEESRETTNGGESRNRTAKSEEDVDAENNLERDETIESENDKKEENVIKVDDANRAMDSDDNHKESSNDECGGDENGRINDENNLANDQNQNKSPDKLRSYSNSIPPPKPQRLRLGGGDGTSSAESSTKEEPREEAMRETSSEETNDKKKPEAIDDHQDRQTSASANSPKFHKVENEEEIGIDAERNAETEKEPIKEEDRNNEAGQDDADVVHSPAPRTGRMSKIFKTKNTRHQEDLENGTNKTRGSVNHKAKSKTCVLL